MLERLRGGVQVLLSADPPDHVRQRKLVNRAFTPPKVKALEPRIREVAHTLFDGFAGRGEAELVHEYGVLLPLTIIAECLGVADEDLPTFKQWSDDFVAAIGNHAMAPDQLRTRLLSQFDFYEYFARKVAERRADPHDDPISDVVHATLAFGHGEHFCLGSALARAEGRIGIEVLLERLADLRPAPGVDLAALAYEPSYVLHGLCELRVAFTPRAG